MILNWTIDAGQIFLGLLITVIGFFLRRELNRFDKTLERHDNILDRLVSGYEKLTWVVEERSKRRT